MDDKCEAWVATYDDPDSFTKDRPAGGIAVSPQGDRIYQTGTSWTHLCEFDPGFNCGDIVTLAYDADGQQLWKAHYAGAAGNLEQGEDVVVSPDGARVYVTGLQDWDFENDGGFAVIAYDAASGSEVWTARYDDAGGGFAGAWSVAVSPDGEEVYATGRTEEQGFRQLDYATVAFDADTGAQLWDARYDGPGAVRKSGTEVSQDFALQVKVSPDGSQVYVTGDSTGTSEGQSPNWMLDYATVAYRAAPPEQPGDPEPGTELWVARLDVGDRDEPWGGMAVSPDGSGVVVTGLTQNRNASGEWATVAYEADTGAEVWVRRHGARLGAAGDLAFSPKGDRVVVVGRVSTHGCCNENDRFGVVAYDAVTGTALWDDAYGLHDPPPDAGKGLNTGTAAAAAAVAVSRDGETVYVSGDSTVVTPAGWRDTAVTVAYDASDGTRQWIAIAHSEKRSSVWWNADTSEKLLVSEDGKRLYLSAFVFGVSSSSYGLLAYDTGETEPTPTPTASPSPTESGSPSPSPSESPHPGLSDVAFTEDSAQSGQYSDETVFEARLRDSNGDPLGGRELSFELVGTGSRTFNATTNDDGVAAVTPRLEEEPGPYQLTVRFAGDEDHAGDADTISFVVEKEDSALALTETKGKDKALVAHLYDVDTPGDGIAGRTIDFYAGAELIGSATTDGDGVATFEPPKQKGQKKAYEAVFEGDDFYLAASDDNESKGGKGGGSGNGGNGGGSGGSGAEASYAGKVLLM